MDLVIGGVFQEHKLDINPLDSCGKGMQHFIQTDRSSWKGLQDRSQLPAPAFLSSPWLKSPEELFLFLPTEHFQRAFPRAGWKSWNIPAAAFPASNCSVLKQIHAWARGWQPQLCRGVLEQGVWIIVQVTEWRKVNFGFFLNCFPENISVKSNQNSWFNSAFV